MLTVRLTHPTGMVEVHTWNADKTHPSGAQTAYENLGITVEILKYTPTA